MMFGVCLVKLLYECMTTYLKKKKTNFYYQAFKLMPIFTVKIASCSFVFLHIPNYFPRIYS